MKDEFERYLTFAKSERIAIITIVTIIVIILITKYLLIKFPPKRTAYFHNLDSIVNAQQREIDSLLTLDSIKNAERKTAYVKRRSDESKTKAKGNKKWRNEYKEKEYKRYDTIDYQRFTEEKTIPIVNINTADTSLFKELPGIGSSFAKRIVEYREKLGGFIESEQLLEVYGMDTTRFSNIAEYIVVDSVFEPNRLKINYDSFKILNKHPYLKYEEVKKIVNYREHKGLITSWTQLEKIVGYGIEPKLEEYVDFE